MQDAMDLTVGSLNKDLSSKKKMSPYTVKQKEFVDGKH